MSKQIEPYKWWEHVPPKFAEKYPLLAKVAAEKRNPESEEEKALFKEIRELPLHVLIEQCS